MNIYKYTETIRSVDASRFFLLNNQTEMLMNIR